MRLRALAWLALVMAATPALAQPADSAATSPQANLQQELQKALGKNANKAALGQAMAVGVILGCTNKRAGREATDSFYREMKEVGKTVEGYCKQGRATEARDVVINTLYAKRNDPVLQGAIGCYDQQSANIAMMAGSSLSADIGHYARWARDPSIAKTEMKTTDICH